MLKQVTYHDLRAIIGMEREVVLTQSLGLAAKVYKRRMEVKRDDASEGSATSGFYFQLVVVSPDNENRRVVLNQADRLMYDTQKGTFWVIPGPGTLKDPVANILTYTNLGQSLIRVSDDPISVGEGVHSMVHGQAAVTQDGTNRRIEGGELILFFAANNRPNVPAHQRYYISSIVTRNGIDRAKAATALKDFLIALLTEDGQAGPLVEFFDAEKRQREQEEAARAEAIVARRKASEAKLNMQRLATERVTDLVSIILDVVSENDPKGRRFTTTSDVTYQIDPHSSGDPAYAVISKVNGRFEIVPILTLFSDGTLEAWARSLNDEATENSVSYYAGEVASAKAAIAACS